MIISDRIANDIRNFFTIGHYNIIPRVSVIVTMCKMIRFCFYGCLIAHVSAVRQNLSSKRLKIVVITFNAMHSPAHKCARKN